MNRFQAHYADEKQIILKNSSDIDRVFDLINDSEDFIVEWTAKNPDSGEEKKLSELIIGTNIVSKVRNGELRITSHE
jgi:hypothetical protein